MKLLTATAAVAALGPDFHFTTQAVAPADVRDGALERLFLVGGGDPLLATPERIALDARDAELAGLPNTPLATLADRIVAAGVRRIPGGVVGVDDRYDRTRYLPEWPASVRTDIGPIGALTVNDGRAGPAGTGAAAADPAVNAATELSRLLVARGVAVGTPGRADHAPDGARPDRHARLAAVAEGPRGAPERLRQPERRDADARARRPRRRGDDRTRRAGDPRRAREAARRSHRRELHRRLRALARRPAHVRHAAVGARRRRAAAVRARRRRARDRGHSAARSR